jgi:hypothetical protein
MLKLLFERLEISTTAFSEFRGWMFTFKFPAANRMFENATNANTAVILKIVFMAF